MGGIDVTRTVSGYGETLFVPVKGGSIAEVYEVSPAWAGEGLHRGAGRFENYHLLEQFTRMCRLAWEVERDFHYNAEQLEIGYMLDGAPSVFEGVDGESWGNELEDMALTKIPCPVPRIRFSPSWPTLQQLATVDGDIRIIAAAVADLMHRCARLIEVNVAPVSLELSRILVDVSQKSTKTYLLIADLAAGPLLLKDVGESASITWLRVLDCLLTDIESLPSGHRLGARRAFDESISISHDLPERLCFAADRVLGAASCGDIVTLYVDTANLIRHDATSAPGMVAAPLNWYKLAKGLMRLLKVEPGRVRLVANRRRYDDRPTHREFFSSLHRASAFTLRQAGWVPGDQQDDIKLVERVRTDLAGAATTRGIVLTGDRKFLSDHYPDCPPSVQLAFLTQPKIQELVRGCIK